MKYRIRKLGSKWELSEKRMILPGWKRIKLFTTEMTAKHFLDDLQEMLIDNWAGSVQHEREFGIDGITTYSKDFE